MATSQSSIVLLCLLALAHKAYSTRLRVASKIKASSAKEIPSGVVSGAGWICQDISDMTRATPNEVVSFMEAHDLTSAYNALKIGLANTPYGTFWSWKGSALARELFLGGHEEAFGKKSVKMFLTKEWGFFRSSFKLCFDTKDAKVDPLILKHKFGSGFTVQAACSSPRDKLMPPGVAAQTFNDKLVKATPTTMPVEVYKMLLAKDAVDLHLEFAEKANGGDHRSHWLSLVTWEFQKRFRAKGLGLYYNQFNTWCCCGDKCQSQCRNIHRWIEYADLHVVEPGYIPTFRSTDSRYPLWKTLGWLRCEGGAKGGITIRELDGVHLPNLAAEVAQDLPKAGCAQIEGAIPRNSEPYPACKCVDTWSKVYCGGDVMGERKFNASTILNNPVCTRPDVYCSRKACPLLR